LEHITKVLCKSLKYCFNRSFSYF